MSERTLSVNPTTARADSREDEVRITTGSNVWDFVSAPSPRRVPLFISRDEAYYWTREWQEGIRRSMADLEAGDYTDFDSDDPDAITRRFVGDED